MADEGIYIESSVTTAHGSTGMLQKILDHCTGGSRPGKDWTVELNQNSKDDGQQDAFSGASPMPKEVILSNTGSSGSENIYVGIREWQYTAGDYYGWDLNGYLTVPGNWNGNSVDHGLDTYDSTYEHWSELPILQLADTTMNYYLRATKDFISLVMEISNDFFGCYLGFGNRLGSPGEYPYPLVVAGSSFGNRRYDYTGTVGPVRPTDGSFFMVSPDNSFNTKDGAGAAQPKVRPMQGNTDTSVVSLGPDSKIFMTPAYGNVNSQTLWSYKSFYVVRGPSMQSGQIYADSGLNVRIHQQGTGTQAYNFLAHEMVTTTTTTTHTTTSTSTSTTTTTTT